MSGERPPEELRRAVANDLRPVRPLPSPWLRVLFLLPLALLLLGFIHFAHPVRFDAERLGAMLLWGLSAAQAVAGLVLLGAALRESLPGRTLSGRLLRIGAGLLLLWLAGVSLATWGRSPTLPPAGHEAFYWRWCSGWPVALGLPLVVTSLWLVRRAWPLRPALAGALCGAGTGLLIDAGWRTYCEVSQLQHIIGSHMLAVVVLTALGALLGGLAGRRR